MIEQASRAAGVAGETTGAEYISSARAVRDRAQQLLQMNRDGRGEFIVHSDRVGAVAKFVVRVIREKYEDLNIPYHSRFNHFRVGGVDREKILDKKIAALPRDERARIKIDLAVTSVLLDAGAGDDWTYTENGHLYSRSEGLAVASYNMFSSGTFSSARENPLIADASGLMQMTEEHIRNGFQVSVSNPLLGAAGRAELLHRLGKAIEPASKYFAGAEYHRPGYLLDYFLKLAPDRKLEASEVLKAVLHGFGPIWPGRLTVEDAELGRVNLGDTWRHSGLGSSLFDSLVPFHKLSQWMTYSLLTPLEEAGFTIVNLDELTGLAEYRNGGLMIDSGLIEPREDYRGLSLHLDSKVIVEWRALTVALLDEIAVHVRQLLDLTAEQLPLAKILEGGTWWAGRKLAFDKRGGRPPFDIISDGTVF